MITCHFDIRVLNGANLFTVFYRGENITSLFLDNVASTFERQMDLRNRRGAICKCARCCDPRELGTDFGTLRCTSPPCTGWVLPVNTPEVDKSDWKCETCAKIYPANDIQELMKTLQEVAKDIPQDIPFYVDTVSCLPYRRVRYI